MLRLGIRFSNLPPHSFSHLLQIVPNAKASEIRRMESDERPLHIHLKSSSHGETPLPAFVAVDLALVAT